MTLWLLRPVKTGKGTPWDPWYDKIFGFVIRADIERRARDIAAAEDYDQETQAAWYDPSLVSCTELTGDGMEGIVMLDVHAA